MGAKAYMASSSNTFDSASKDSAAAFIDATLTKSNSVYDPACAASALAYLDAKIDQESDEVAGKAAAEAYVQAYVDNGGKRSEACKKSISTLIKIQGVLSNSVEL